MSLSRFFQKRAPRMSAAAFRAGLAEIRRGHAEVERMAARSLARTLDKAGEHLTPAQTMACVHYAEERGLNLEDKDDWRQAVDAVAFGQKCGEDRTRMELPAEHYAAERPEQCPPDMINDVVRFCEEHGLDPEAHWDAAVRAVRLANTPRKLEPGVHVGPAGAVVVPSK
jgi:hypothetical protein